MAYAPSEKNPFPASAGPGSRAASHPPIVCGTARDAVAPAQRRERGYQHNRCEPAPIPWRTPHWSRTIRSLEWSWCPDSEVLMISFRRSPVSRVRRQNRSTCPGRIGRSGRERSSAWIWLFSSTHSTSARPADRWHAIKVTVFERSGWPPSKRNPKRTTRPGTASRRGARRPNRKPIHPAKTGLDRARQSREQRGCRPSLPTVEPVVRPTVSTTCPGTEIPQMDAFIELQLVEQSLPAFRSPAVERATKLLHHQRQRDDLCFGRGRSGLGPRRRHLERSSVLTTVKGAKQGQIVGKFFIRFDHGFG